jgi:rhamnose transport system ATP-binding protein
VVTGLVGENGAGKTTLVKILTGVYRPDSGVLEMDGAPLRLHGPTDARRRGIAVVHQELGIFPDLTVAENVFMGRFPTGPFYAVDRKKMEAQVEAALAELGLWFDPACPMGRLSVGKQQLVEIAKALISEARILVLDEATASLTPTEVADQFRVIRELKTRGLAVLFVSHRLDEVFQVCDRIAIMRDGELILSSPTSEISVDEVIRHMVGRRLDSYYPRPTGEPKEVALSVRDLNRSGVFKHVSLDVRKGEIVGLAALVGAGRTEIALSLFGIDHADAASVARARHALAIEFASSVASPSSPFRRQCPHREVAEPEFYRMVAEFPTTRTSVIMTSSEVTKQVAIGNLKAAKCA